MAAERKYPRHLVPELREALETARIVNLIGPRQVGKTTLVRDLLAYGKYITLDDESIRGAILGDAAGQLDSLRREAGEGPLIIDEAQRLKDLALAIKLLVDGDTRKGQFLLTGSSNVFTTATVADSLPGRIRTLRLWPMTVSEAKETKGSRLLDWATQDAPALDQIQPAETPGREDYIELLLKGGFPEPRVLPIRPRQRMYRDYVDSVVDRDVAEILAIRKTDRLRGLVMQMAARTGAGSQHRQALQSHWPGSGHDRHLSGNPDQTFAGFPARCLDFGREPSRHQECQVPLRGFGDGLCNSALQRPIIPCRPTKLVGTWRTAGELRGW